jgi:flavin reductase (DIM6/NTAB) family NADH-FMN oxidoreductase RutF
VRTIVLHRWKLADERVGRIVLVLVLASLPLPVVIVAAGDGEDRACATATAMYVSLEPPLIATPLRPGSRTRRLAEASGEFSVSVLSDRQAELAVHPEPEARDCVAVYRCSVENAQGPLLVGRVQDTRTSDAEPLLRFRRRYRGLGAELDVAEEADYPL